MGLDVVTLLTFYFSDPFIDYVEAKFYLFGFFDFLRLMITRKLQATVCLEKESKIFPILLFILIDSLERFLLRAPQKIYSAINLRLGSVFGQPNFSVNFSIPNKIFFPS